MTIDLLLHAFGDIDDYHCLRHRARATTGTSDRRAVWYGLLSDVLLIHESIREIKKVTMFSRSSDKPTRIMNKDP